MLTRLFCIYIILVVCLTGTVADGAEYVAGELLIRFAPKLDGKQMTAAEQNQILTSVNGGTIEQTFKIVPGLTVVKLPAGLMVEDALKTFNETDRILYAQPNYIYHALSTFPSDVNFPNQWGLHNTGQTIVVDEEAGKVYTGTPDSDIDASLSWCDRC